MGIVACLYNKKLRGKDIQDPAVGSILDSMYDLFEEYFDLESALYNLLYSDLED